MTRESRRELERTVEELEADGQDGLEWIDFMKLANGAAEPADYGLTAPDVRREWRAFLTASGVEPAGEAR